MNTTNNVNTTNNENENNRKVNKKKHTKKKVIFNLDENKLIDIDVLDNQMKDNINKNHEKISKNFKFYKKYKKNMWTYNVDNYKINYIESKCKIMICNNLINNFNSNSNDIPDNTKMTNLLKSYMFKNTSKLDEKIIFLLYKTLYNGNIFIKRKRRSLSKSQLIL